MCGAFIQKCAINSQYFVELNYLQQEMTQDGPHFQGITTISTKILKFHISQY